MPEPEYLPLRRPLTGWFGICSIIINMPFIIVVACILINAVATVVGRQLPPEPGRQLHHADARRRRPTDFGSLRSDLILSWPA